MKFSKDNIIKRKLQALTQLINRQRLEIPEWKTKGGIFLKTGGYRDVDSEYSVIHVGDRWKCWDDATRWFVADITVPDNFSGSKLALELEFGGEGIVRVNGQIISAITSYLVPQEATRTRVLLSESAVPGTEYHVEIEAHLNYMEFCRFRDMGYHEIEYTIRTAALVAIDTDVEAYCFDIQTVFDAMKVLRNPIDILAKSPVRIPDNIAVMLESFSKDTYFYDKVKDALVSSISCIDFDFEPDHIRSTIPAARSTLTKKLNQIPNQAHMLIKFVGQAHIDTAWLWPIRESIRKSAKTLSNVCSLMDQYPEFTFAFSQPQLFEFIKNHYPDLYERVKEKIASGKLEPVGNTWVEMDTNIPSGESLIRQILYGRQFFLQEFGKCSEVFWMPDVFGYSWALPQIIKRSGMKYFFTSKLIGNDDNRFPHSLFQWQGVDGTRIPAYLQRLNYNGRINADTLYTLYSRFDQKNVIEEAFMTFGFGDGGGGPTYQMLETARRLENFPGLPKMEMSTAASFFHDTDDIFSELPVWNDEMYYEFHRGTYTSQANVKKNNRKCELLYRQTEMANVFAMEDANSSYPYADILKGYKKLLTNQFHDIMPGSSIHPVYEDAEKDYAEIKAIGSHLLESAAERLANQIAHDGNALILWNFLSWNRTDYADFNLTGTHFENISEICVVDNAGKPVPSTLYTENEKKILRFLAADVPAMGYRVYYLSENPSASVKETVKVMPDRMENKFYTVQFDANGNITDIYDKRCKRPILNSTSNLLKIFEDKPAAETAWNIDIEYQNKEWILEKADSIEVIQNDDICGILRIKRSFHKSAIRQDIILYSDIDRIDFHTVVDWYETEKMLKAEFHPDVLSSRATYEIQFGAIERPTHDNTSYDRTKFEVSGHKWADLSEGSYGISLLNDCKYGYDIKESRMRLTLLRSPINPDPVADKGHHEFTYSIRPHSGNWIQAETVNAAYQLNVPLYPVYCSEAVAGGMPSEKSYLSSSEKNVIVDTIKASEEKDGIIVRVYEATGSHTNVVLTTHFAASKVMECNLMEIEEQLLPYADGKLVFSIKPFEIKTFKFIK
ncbi:MAG: alpha-mannosidase [Candidatus Merdivicinus sp.]|jgi:alpha-mannosidase